MPLPNAFQTINSVRYTPPAPVSRGPTPSGRSYYNPYTGGYQASANIGPLSRYAGSQVRSLTTDIPNSGGGGGGGGGIAGGNPYQGLQNNVEQNKGEDLGLVDQEYEQALSALSDQENLLRGEAVGAEGKVRAEAQGYETKLGQQKQQTEGVIAGQETQARQEEATGLRGARDIFRQIQQESIAKLSGLGISSSSVAEALAEKLGVETSRRIAGITGSTQEVLQNLNKERLRIQQVFTDKVQQVKDQLQIQIGEIQQNLMSGIQKLQNQRGQAAIEKAKARTGIIQAARENITQLQFEAQEYQRKLEAAALKRQQDIENTIPLFQVSDAGVQGLNPKFSSMLSSLQQQFPNQLLSPQTAMRNGQPVWTGQLDFRSPPKKEDEDGEGDGFGIV